MIAVDPGALVPNVGHLEQVRIETCPSQCFAEQGFVSLRRAGGHDHPVETVLANPIDQGVEGFGGACEHEVSHMDYICHFPGLLHDLRDFDHSRNIGAAMAHEHPNAGRTIYRQFRRDIGLFDVGDSCVCQENGRLGRRRSRLNDRFRNVLWRFDAAANEDTRF